MTAESEVRRPRGPLLILLALFLVPLVLAFALYYGTGWRPQGRTHHGELLDPARPLAPVSLVRADGRPTGSDFLKGRWSLVYVDSGRCDARCRQRLVDTRQIRLALDRQASRVQRVFLYDGACCDTRITTEHADLIAARVDDANGAALLRPFPGSENVPGPRAGRLYLVDPRGNLVLSYPPDAGRAGVLEDLERLLKLSHIG